VIYRTVLGYYRGGGHELHAQPEDALDMRKAMPRDATRRVSSVVPLTKPIMPEDLEWH
jgi:N-terminal acetyltransferase B complex catalytic subunit